LIAIAFEKTTTPQFLLLDQISDVRNFGAIIRTEECAGVQWVVIQKQGNAPISADTIKTSAGAAFKMPICKVDHRKDAIFQFQAEAIQLVAAKEKQTLYYDINLTLPTAIIMGPEDSGITLVANLSAYVI